VSGDGEFLAKVLDCLHDGVYYVDVERRISYWNKGAERISGFTGAEVVGKHCWDNLLGHVDEEGNALCLVGCALTQAMADGLPRERVAYLHHKLGHRVPVRMRVVPLRDSAGQIYGAVEVFSDDFTQDESRQRIRELEKLAYLDELTGLANRRFLDISLQIALSEHARYGWPFGVVMMDLDGFKGTNDRFGHCAGDEVLRTVARTLSGNSRPSDVVGRWGGDEFLAVVKNVDEDQVLKVAEKYCRLVRASSVRNGNQTIGLGLSAGTAAARHGDTSYSLVARADRSMYRVKSSRGLTAEREGTAPS
jgi:diguanylate cyclase (GGDEF)-like protein/PAS domain S-box-containing protein